MPNDPEVGIKLTSKSWNPEEPPPSEFYVVDIATQPSQEGMPVGEVSFVKSDTYWPMKEKEYRWVVQVTVTNVGTKPLSNLRVILDVEFAKPWRYFADNTDVTRWDEICNTGITTLNLEWLAPEEENACTFYICNRTPLAVQCRPEGSEEEWQSLKPLITDPTQVEKRHRKEKAWDEW